MTAPPKYPRIPHLGVSAAATTDDVVLDRAAHEQLLHRSVVVEEKLDGMNVTIWMDGGVPHVATRGGERSRDRSGERGRLMRWAAGAHDALDAALGGNLALYAEWVRRRHAVAYEALPGPLVGLDVYDRHATRFLAIDERDRILAELGIPPPPRRFHGVLGSESRLLELLGRSAFAAVRAEGLVVRTPDRETVAKVVDPVYRGIGTAPWLGENLIASSPSARR